MTDEPTDLPVDQAEPRTAAGRQLLDSLPTEWHPINTDIMRDHIIAIEAEAAAGSGSPCPCECHTHGNALDMDPESCDECGGTGRVAAAGSGSLDVLRRLADDTQRLFDHIDEQAAIERERMLARDPLRQPRGIVGVSAKLWENYLRADLAEAINAARAALAAGSPDEGES